MPAAQVKPVIQPEVRQLCVKPYPGHPRGCPNHGKRATCPPQARMLYDLLDPAGPIWAVWNRFDLAAHVERMRAKHPDWSWRQLTCCLYWQRGARKQLVREALQLMNTEMLDICAALSGAGRPQFVACPEAMGVNVTATMEQIGITLEWPPKTVTYQVGLVGYYRGHRGSDKPDSGALTKEK